MALELKKMENVETGGNTLNYAFYCPKDFMVFNDT